MPAEPPLEWAEAAAAAAAAAAWAASISAIFRSSALRRLLFWRTVLASALCSCLAASNCPWRDDKLAPADASSLRPLATCVRRLAARAARSRLSPARGSVRTIAPRRVRKATHAPTAKARRTRIPRRGMDSTSAAESLTGVALIPEPPDQAGGSVHEWDPPRHSQHASGCVPQTAVHDGLDKCGQGFHDWFPGALHQIDHFHVAERMWEVLGADPKIFQAPKAPAFGHWMVAEAAWPPRPQSLGRARGVTHQRLIPISSWTWDSRTNATRRYP